MEPIISLKRKPNPSLLYQVALFAIEPAWETRQMSGSLGRVGWDGDLDWHVEVIQVRRIPLRYSSGAAIAVVYMRIPERESPNVVYDEDVGAAHDLVQRLIAPMEWASARPLSVRALQAENYRGDGKALGGSIYSNVIWNAGGGGLGGGRLDPAYLEQYPELGLAISFYTRGIAAAEERFLPTACMDYCMAIESLIGSTKHTEDLERECQRLGIDFEPIEEFLAKTRAKYAIAHALDKVKRGRDRRLKDIPTSDVERLARELTAGVIRAYIGKLKPLDHSEELRKGMRYSGLPPVATNLPLPREALWHKIGPWDQAAPGMAPDVSLSLAEAQRAYGISRWQLRRLLKKRPLIGHKNGIRWQISGTSLEMYQSLAAEHPADFRRSLYTRFADAASDTGQDVSEIRELVRTRQVAGYMRARWGRRDMIDVNSLRYYHWRKRREKLDPGLYRPKPKAGSRRRRRQR